MTARRDNLLKKKKRMAAYPNIPCVYVCVCDLRGECVPKGVDVEGRTPSSHLHATINTSADTRRCNLEPDLLPRKYGSLFIGPNTCHS